MAKVIKFHSMNSKEIQKERWDNIKENGLIKCVDICCQEINDRLPMKMDYVLKREIQEELFNIEAYINMCLIKKSELKEYIRDMNQLEEYRKIAKEERVTPKAFEEPMWFSEDNQTQVGIEKLQRAEDFAESVDITLDELLALNSAVNQNYVYSNIGKSENLTMKKIGKRLCVTDGNNLFYGKDYMKSWWLKEDKSE